MAAPSDATVATREIAELQRAAQERLALIGAVASIQEWRNVNPSQATASAVLPRLKDFVQTLRRVNTKLATRYYNLVRSIEVGYALPNPYGQPYGRNVTVSQLYQELGDVLREVIADPTGHTHAAPLTRLPAVEEEQPADTDREDKLDEDLKELQDDLQSLFDSLREKYEPLFDAEVPVDETFEWPDVITDDFADLERDVKDQVKALTNNIALIERDENASAAELDLRVRDQTRLRGFVLAGSTIEQVQEPGRYLVNELIRQDKRAKGWMRATGPHPCAFCAMLASRGVAYDKRPDFHTHDHCMCWPIPVFTKNPSLSARDKFFIDNWAEVTRGYKSGKRVKDPRTGQTHIRDNDKLRAWRRWLTQQYRAHKVPDQDVYGPARPAN